MYEVDVSGLLVEAKAEQDAANKVMELIGCDFDTLKVKNIFKSKNKIKNNCMHSIKNLSGNHKCSIFSNKHLTTQCNSKCMDFKEVK